MGKIGDGHASAMLRQGVKELRSAMYTQSNVASPTEYGMYGTMTPGEVSQSREGAMEPDEERMATASIVESRVQQSKDRVQERDQTLGIER